MIWSWFHLELLRGDDPWLGVVLSLLLIVEWRVCNMRSRVMPIHESLESEFCESYVSDVRHSRLDKLKEHDKIFNEIV